MKTYSNFRSKSLFNVYCLAFGFVLCAPIVFAVNLTNEWQNAIFAYRQQNYELALSHFNEILKVETNNSFALTSRGSCYKWLKQYENAEKDLTAAVEASTNNILLSAALLNRGYFYSETTNLDKAINDYSKAVQYNPSFASAYAYRANVEITKGAYEAAMQDCNMAVMLNPDSAEAYDFRGRIYFQTGKYDKCIADYSKAIELNTNDWWYYSQRATAFSQKDNNASAISDFSEALKFAPESEISGVYSSYGLCLSKVGQFENGIDDCKKAVGADTNSVVALNNLAWLLSTAPDAKLRDGKKAVEYATRACGLTDWKNAYCLGTLATAYAEVGNFDEAIKWERKCILIGLPDKDIGQARIELNLFEDKKPYHAKK